jgi:hypothetical protein
MSIEKRLERLAMARHTQVGEVGAFTSLLTFTSLLIRNRWGWRPKSSTAACMGCPWGSRLRWVSSSLAEALGGRGSHAPGRPDR